MSAIYPPANAHDIVEYEAITVFFQVLSNSFDHPTVYKCVVQTSLNIPNTYIYSRSVLLLKYRIISYFP
jgi:hypothetical protein